MTKEAWSQNEMVSRKESCKLTVPVFSFGKANPHPSPCRYDPSSTGNYQHEKKQVNRLGILSLEERLDSTIQR